MDQVTFERCPFVVVHPIVSKRDPCIAASNRPESVSPTEIVYFVPAQLDIGNPHFDANWVPVHLEGRIVNSVDCQLNSKVLNPRAWPSSQKAHGFLARIYVAVARLAKFRAAGASKSYRMRLAAIFHEWRKLALESE